MLWDYRCFLRSRCDHVAWLYLRLLFPSGACFSLDSGRRYGRVFYECGIRLTDRFFESDRVHGSLCRLVAGCCG